MSTFMEVCLAIQAVCIVVIVVCQIFIWRTRKRIEALTAELNRAGRVK